MISSLEVEVPGQHVYTLTSTQSLLKDVPFKEVLKLEPPKPPPKKEKVKTAKSEEKKNRALSLKGDEKDSKPKDGDKKDIKQDESDEAVTVLNGQVQKKGNDKKEENDTEKDANNDDSEGDDEEEKLIVLKNDAPLERVIYGGSLLVLIGWKGYGPNMPPANAGGFGVFRPAAKKPELAKPQEADEALDQELRKIFDDELLMDVNDPRNYETIERIRKMRNKQIRNILKHDVKIPLWETPSLRHKLIKMKFTDPELMSIDLPLREELI